MKYCTRQNCKHAQAAHDRMFYRCLSGALTKHPCGCRRYKFGDLLWSTAQTKMELQRLYQSLIPEIRRVARTSGYAIGVHGSLRRDLDLIAAPWTEKAVSPTLLAKRITRAVTGFSYEKYQPTKKPHGRIAFAIYVGTHAYIDLSVMPMLAE